MRETCLKKLHDSENSTQIIPRVVRIVMNALAARPFSIQRSVDFFTGSPFLNSSGPGTGYYLLVDESRKFLNFFPVFFRWQGNIAHIRHNFRGIGKVEINKVNYLRAFGSHIIDINEYRSG